MQIQTINCFGKKVVVMIALIFIGNITCAQKLKLNAVTKTQSNSFITEKVNSSDIMTVHNSKNIYHNKIPKNRNPDITVVRGDKSGMLDAFTQVFSDERLKQLLPEKIIQMTFYLSPSGRILEIEFLLDKNTLVTAQELESLEKAIKANVWFKLRPEEIKGEDFIDISSGVRYSRVLDRTLK